MAINSLRIGAGAVVEIGGGAPAAFGVVPDSSLAVPEPGAAALLAGGVLTMLGLRRRRS